MGAIASFQSQEKVAFSAGTKPQPTEQPGCYIGFTAVIAECSQARPNLALKAE